MVEQFSEDQLKGGQPVFDQVSQEVDFETLRSEFTKRAITVEKTQLEQAIPTMEMSEFIKLAGTAEGQRANNLARRYKDLVDFLQDYYYIIDDFKNDNKKRLDVRDQIMEEFGQQYGDTAKNKIEDLYEHSKLRNNTLLNIHLTIKHLAEALEYNPANAGKTETLLSFHEQISGENDPQNYEGAERVEKVQQMDRVIQSFLIELKKLSENT